MMRIEEMEGWLDIYFFSSATASLPIKTSRTPYSLAFEAVNMFIKQPTDSDCDLESNACKKLGFNVRLFR
jgi:hypothetical protein